MKKSTVLRSVMLAATVAAIGTMSLVGSADTVPTSEVTATEEEKGFEKVATFEIGADSNGTVVDVEVTGDVINIEPGIVSLDGDLYLSEVVEDSDTVFKIRVLTEDENGEIQANDIEPIDNGNGYFYYKWYSKS